MVVPLGKFGLADDFSFGEHNATSALCALDNTVPNCYCNAALIMLHQLPWLRVHCLGSLASSQFLLSDELGFLFHMMDASRGAACQPRNFQRALTQSREASALKLVDAVDLEGNVAANTSLPEIICKFASFVLEQLSKEAREAAKEAAREAAKENERTRAAEAKRDRELLAGAAPDSKGSKGDKPNIDAIVAKAYADRLAAANKRGASGAAGGAEAGATAEPVVGRTPLEEIFQSSWRETSVFPGAKAAPVPHPGSIHPPACVSLPPPPAWAPPYPPLHPRSTPHPAPRPAIAGEPGY